MRKTFLISVFAIINLIGYCQTTKIRVVFVANIDTVFTLVTFEKDKQLSINFRQEWENDLRQNLDSAKYELRFDTLPKNLKKISPSTIWFSKRNSKIKNWLLNLQEKGYDIIVLLFKPILVDTEYVFLSNGYGLLMESNKAYSINGVNAYRISDLKLLARMGLWSIGDFIKNIDKKDKITKSIDNVNKNDLTAAINGVRELNRKIAIENVCKKMNSEEFQNKYYKTK